MKHNLVSKDPDLVAIALKQLRQVHELRQFCESPLIYTPQSCQLATPDLRKKIKQWTDCKVLKILVSLDTLISHDPDYHQENPVGKPVP